MVAPDSRATGQLQLATPPNQWLAALLSFVVPGLGQLYGGSWRRALGFVAAAVAATFLGSYALLLLVGLPGVILARAVTLGVMIAASVDASRLCSQWQSGRLRPAWTRWFVLVPVLLVAALCYDGVNRFRKDHLVEAYSFPGASMEPTLLPGDDVIVDKRAGARLPEHGAVLAHESTGTDAMSVVHRIIALSGDTIAMRSGVVWLNGRPLVEPYVESSGTPAPLDSAGLQQMLSWQLPHAVRSSTAAYAPDLSTWGPVVVPPDSCFVLGDNRNDSYDSRYFGFIANSRIAGRVRYVYLSRAPAGGIRWARFGKSVE